MRLFILAAYLFLYSFANAQVESFVDPRDGNIYETIVIGNKKWFRDHIRLQTRTSFCPSFNKNRNDCDNGNYYLNSDLDSVCPKGWRVANTDDWREYINYAVTLNQLSLDSLEALKYAKGEHSVVIQLNEEILKDTLLRLKAIGWVEGNKVENRSSLTLWMSNHQTGDNKNHIHLGKRGFVLHSHDHHIIDKPKNIRKFAVRCVCDVKNDGK